MADEFTEVTHRSWFSRIGSAIIQQQRLATKKPQRKIVGKSILRQGRRRQRLDVAAYGQLRRNLQASPFGMAVVRRGLARRVKACLVFPRFEQRTSLAKRSDGAVYRTA